MPDFFSLSARGFTTTVLIASSWVTPAEGAGCPGEVPATATVTTPADVVDGSIPAVSAEPPAGTSSPANLTPNTFWRLGSGGEAEGLQNSQVGIQQLQDLTILQDGGSIPGGFDYESFAFAYHPMTRGNNGKASTNSTDDPGELFLFAFPSVALSARGSRSRSSCRWAEHEMLEPFFLQPRHWEEGGPDGGCRIVVDNSGTMLCVPAEDSQYAVTEQHKLFQVVKNLPALEDFVQRTAPGRRAPC
jgi:hypothetical protein